MTEREWLKNNDPRTMLGYLESTANPRKFRLLACGCCRRIWPHFNDERSRKGIEVAEFFADDEVSRSELRAASLEAGSVGHYSMGRAGAAAGAAAEATYDEDVYGSCYHISLLTYHAYCAAGENEAEYVAQSHLLRDIFGNPFRPVAADPAWRTPTVRSIAEAIYRDRAFDRLPILADALEEAGCTNADVLLHCREPSEHARGCWVVDSVLGKG